MNLPHDFVLGKYNDITATRKLLSRDIGAILVEPMQAAGGMRPASPQFLEFLRSAATSIGAVLIFDEIVTSRLHYHGLQGAWNVKPDMTTLGKYLGGGLPFGAFGGRAEIMSQFESTEPGGRAKLHHSGTFNNNVVTMSAAVAAAALVTPDKLDRMNRLGDRLRTAANDIVRESRFDTMSFTGYGSGVGVQFHGSAASIMRALFYFFVLDGGVIIGRRGFLSLNLVHTDDMVDNFLSLLKTFVERYGSDASDAEAEMRSIGSMDHKFLEADSITIMENRFLVKRRLET
jgi:glutamate-1-semialdehyde 2,1-aminomutase